MNFRALFFLLTIPLTIIGLLIVAASWILITTPDAREMKGCMITKMYDVSLCPKDSSYVRLDQISTVMQQAVIVSEDSSFFSHQGFDWFEMKNSLDKNLASRTFARGGSTITQQLAKNVFLSKDKTIARKLREALLTYQIEKNFTKREILEKYLNVVEFGPNIYGIKAASQYYFHKAPSELHMLDAAFLAFLLPNPKDYSVSYNKKSLTKFARQRILQIIHRLAAFKKIPESSYLQAKAVVDTFPWRQLSVASFAPVSQNLENEEEIKINDAGLEEDIPEDTPFAQPAPAMPSVKLDEQLPLDAPDSDGSQGDAEQDQDPEVTE